MKKKNYPEQELQKACFDLLQMMPPVPGLFYTAINPIPYKTIHVRNLSKAMGMIAGVPDWLFIYKGRTFFIEMKAAKGKLSDAQQSAIDAIWSAGIPTYICKSTREFIDILKSQDVPIKIKET